MREIIGWCPDCDGPLYRKEIRTMQGSRQAPCCPLCGLVEKKAQHG